MRWVEEIRIGIRIRRIHHRGAEDTEIDEALDPVLFFSVLLPAN